MRNKIFKISAITLLVMAFAFGVSAQKRPTAHQKVQSGLIAKQTNTAERIKIEKKEAFVDFGFEEAEPEIDIYTEGWNSRLVNPYNASKVPNQTMLDVTGYAMPCKSNRVTSPYGYRAKFGRMHKGMDIGIRSNDTIYAAFDGKVRLTNYEAKGYGNYVILRHTNSMETVYGHLNKFLVKPNQSVRAGDPIALGGSTGRSTGPHLHFETRYMGYAINPAAIFDFPNRCTHVETYAFNKSTYTQPYSSGRTYTLASNNVATHKVKTGETLSSIARTYGLSIVTLCNLNGINKESALRPGQELKVK